MVLVKTKTYLRRRDLIIVLLTLIALVFVLVRIFIAADDFSIDGFAGTDSQTNCSNSSNTSTDVPDCFNQHPETDILNTVLTSVCLVTWLLFIVEIILVGLRTQWETVLNPKILIVEPLVILMCFVFDIVNLVRSNGLWVCLLLLIVVRLLRLSKLKEDYYKNINYDQARVFAHERDTAQDQAYTLSQKYYDLQQTNQSMRKELNKLHARSKLPFERDSYRTNPIFKSDSSDNVNDDEESFETPTVASKKNEKPMVVEVNAIILESPVKQYEYDEVTVELEPAPRVPNGLPPFPTKEVPVIDVHDAIKRMSQRFIADIATLDVNDPEQSDEDKPRIYSIAL